eukprot:1152491-Pyramimonas_sp.AAC.1
MQQGWRTLVSTLVSEYDGLPAATAGLVPHTALKLVVEQRNLCVDLQEPLPEQQPDGSFRHICSEDQLARALDRFSREWPHGWGAPITMPKNGSKSTHNTIGVFCDRQGLQLLDTHAGWTPGGLELGMVDVRAETAPKVAAYICRSLIEETD